MFVAKPHKNNSLFSYYLFFLNVHGVLICFCCFCLYFISLVLCAFEHSYAHKCRIFFFIELLFGTQLYFAWCSMHLKN